MLTPTSDGKDKKSAPDSPLYASLRCAYEVMTERIIRSPSDMIGILLHGVDKTKFDHKGKTEEGYEGSGFQYCHLLVDLGIPDAEAVKTLKNLIEDREEVQRLIVPSKEPASIANTMFYASNLFSDKAANFLSRRLFIVTDNDKPHGKDNQIKLQATQRAKDLNDLDVRIELFPLVREGETFNRSNFYDVRPENPLG
jgi:ATP-dependent DNA helicase 2 subunit 1